MMISADNSLSLRVMILAPTGKDAALTAAILGEATIASIVCPDMAYVERAIKEGGGAVLIAEEAISNGGFLALAAALAGQEPWSDMPVLLLTRYGADSSTVAKALQDLGNVALLERPVRPATLISAVRAALKARARQYQVRAQMIALHDADRRKDEFLATLAHELRN